MQSKEEAHTHSPVTVGSYASIRGEARGVGRCERERTGGVERRRSITAKFDGTARGVGGMVVVVCVPGIVLDVVVVGGERMVVSRNVLV
jgi:hypothetical protein